LYSVNALLELRDKLILLGYSTNICLKLLLTQEERVINDIYDGVSVYDNFSEGLLNLFNINFRYMLLNCKNSQDVYIGMWLYKESAFTQFEILYNILNTVPYQTLIGSYIVMNRDRMDIEMKMNNCVTNIDPFDKKFYELL
jgi:hypothetical protein